MEWLSGFAYWIVDGRVRSLLAATRVIWTVSIRHYPRAVDVIFVHATFLNYISAQKKIHRGRYKGAYVRDT